MSLIDKGTCYFDTEAKMTPVIRDGVVVGWYYCPYIPKALIDNNNSNNALTSPK